MSAESRPDLMPRTLDGALARLTEECGEVLQVIGKIGRFGVDAQDGKTGLVYHNGADLRMELVDLRKLMIAAFCSD